MVGREGAVDQDPPQDPPEGNAVTSGSKYEGYEEDLISPRRLLLGTALAIVGLMVVVAILGYYFRAPLVALSRGFVDNLGEPGIAVGYAIPDAFTVPIPNDTFGMFGIAAGLGFWQVVAWGTSGSIAGGSLGWVIGRWLRKVRLVDRFMSGRGRALQTLVQRYGVWVVGIAAVTPLPYSLSAWAAGAVRMPFFTFVSVSLLRVIRVAGSLYIIHLGLISTG